MLPCAAHGDPPPKTRWLRVGPGFPIDGVHLDLPNFKVIPGEGLYLKHVLPSQDGFYECQAISVVGTNSIGKKYELSSRTKNLPSKCERNFCVIYNIGILLG